MNSISIYGAGHLTHTLLQGLVQVTKIPVYIYNRTKENINGLCNIYPLLNICSNLTNLVHPNSVILLHIPGSSILNLPPEFLTYVKSTDSILVSCAGSLKFELLQKKFQGLKIIRALPSINWNILKGVTFIKENSLVTKEEFETVSRFFSQVSLIAPLNDENDFDRIGELSSCFPGLLSEFLTQIFSVFNITDELQKGYLHHSILGSITNIISTCKTHEEMIEEVAVKGGLTEAGIIALRETMPNALLVVKDKMSNKIETRIENFSKI